MAKAIRVTEEQLDSMLAKKNGVSINSSIGATTTVIQSNKILLGKQEEPNNQKIVLSANIVKKTSTSKLNNVTKINQVNQAAIVKTTISDKHISLVFEGAKLLTINDIFALLQRPKLQHSVFLYKKNWHNIVSNVLNVLYLQEKNKGNTLPFFDQAVEVTIFRQAPTLVDEDALTTMFKFIIDALKRTKENKYGVLAEDNQKIMHKILCYCEKGPHCIGIKIKLIEDNKKEAYNADKLLDF